MIETMQKLKGDVEVIIDYKDGTREFIAFPNTVLNIGKAALASTLAGEIGTTFNYYVCKMAFGSNGTVGGVPRYVEATRDGLFGPVTLSKNVIATIDPSNPTQVIFTAILTYSDAVDEVLNEMGLVMADDNYYSVATFGDVTKTSLMQITWNWKLSFV